MFGSRISLVLKKHRGIEGLICVSLMNLGGSHPGGPPPTPQQPKRRGSLNVAAPELYSKICLINFRF